MAEAQRIRVEVAYATPARQTLLEVRLPIGASAGDAIDAVAPELGLDAPDGLEIGVWGRVCPRSRQLCDGDRVELYRPLAKDPRTARRELAESG